MPNLPDWTALQCTTGSPAACALSVTPALAPAAQPAGAPDEGPSYTDGDAAAQVFGAIAPIGLKKMELHKLVLPRESAAH